MSRLLRKEMENGKGRECKNEIMYMSWPPKLGDIGNTGLEFVLLLLTWERVRLILSNLFHPLLNSTKYFFH
jgi:hypothetical protein